MSLTSVKEYFTPNDNEEVLGLLKKYGDGALIVAGGSFVHGLEARDLLSGIEALIDIQDLGLDQVKSDSAGLSIGAMVTFAQLQKINDIQDSAAFGAVRDALKYPPMQIRNVATVGGNIASACPYFDLPTALIALDAIVTAQGPGGSREIELKEFFASLFENTLEDTEFVTGIVVPPLPARSASAFIKFETNANDLAIVNVAVRVTVDESGSCREARVVIGGGVGETPVRAPASESLLQSETLSDELLCKAGEAVLSDLQPMSDHRASAEYRSALAKTLTERALQQAVARISP
ncbi:MAG: FAD binding domain-containing protein [Woeseiaceae bacterium]